MSLINIEYGSLASSEVMNQNFSFLDEKLDDVFGELESKIASITSNFATLNSRLNDLVGEINDAVSDYTNKLDLLKIDMQAALDKVIMAPNWNAIYNISNLSSYESMQNGYLLISVKDSTHGYLKINDRNIDSSILSSSLAVLPIRKNDVIDSTYELSYCRFLPALAISLN